MVGLGVGQFAITSFSPCCQGGDLTWGGKSGAVSDPLGEVFLLTLLGCLSTRGWLVTRAIHVATERTEAQSG